MKKFLLFFFILFANYNAHSQWFWQNPLPQGNSLSGMSFINAQTGCAVGATGAIVRTTNGGTNRITQYCRIIYTFKSVYFANLQTGRAVGEHRAILKTTNGGSVFISKLSSGVPDKFSLSQNYPNPFNPAKKIIFEIPVHGMSSPHALGGDPVVTLKIFDILGKEVATLVNERLQPGTYEISFSINQISNY